jgi:hypothetical protein
MQELKVAPDSLRPVSADADRRRLLSSAPPPGRRVAAWGTRISGVAE